MRNRNRSNFAIAALGLLLTLETVWLTSLAASEAASAPGSVQAAPSSRPPDTPSPPGGSLLIETADEETIPVCPIPMVPSEEEREASRAVPEAEIELIRPDGARLRYASVLAMDPLGTSVVARGGTSDDGIARFPADDRLVDLFIDAVTMVHQAPGIRLTTGRQRITLPEGLSVSGRVMLGDRLARAADGLWVDVIRDEDPRIEGLPSLPRSELRDDSPLPIRCEVGEDGCFRCSSFEDGWKGRLAVRPFERVGIVDPARPDRTLVMIPVTAPAADLVLNARLFPVIRGHLAVRDQSRFPLVGIEVTSRAPDLFGGAHAARRESDWRFEIPLMRPPQAPLRLRLSGWAAGDVAKVIEVPGPYDRDVDLGAIEFPGPPSRRGFLVTDEQDHPVEGAVVRLADANAVFSQPTDAQGKTAMDLAGPVTRVAVSALGWKTAEVDLSDRQGDVRMHLARTTRVDVRIKSRGVDAFAWGSISPAEPGSRPDGDAEILVRDGMHESYEARPRFEWCQCNFLATHGAAAVSGLPAGVPLLLSVWDGTPLARVGPRLVLAPGEWRAVEIELPDSGVPLRGRVTTEDGTPIQNAHVEARRARPGGGQDFRHAVATDTGGSFEIPGVTPGKLRLSIAGPGLSPLCLEDVDASAIEGKTFVLRPGRVVRVSVIDEAGDPWLRPWYGPGCHHDWEAWIVAPGSDFRFWPDAVPVISMGGSPQSPAGRGIYDFRGLPEGSVTIHVEGVGEKIYTLEHDTRIPEARFVIPPHGRLVAALGSRLDCRIVRLRLDAVAGNAAPLTVMTSGIDYEGAITLPAVLPGDYRASIEAMFSNEWRPATSESLITIRSGATATVLLRE